MVLTGCLTEVICLADVQESIVEIVYNEESASTQLWLSERFLWCRPRGKKSAKAEICFDLCRHCTFDGEAKFKIVPEMKGEIMYCMFLQCIFINSMALSFFSDAGWPKLAVLEQHKSIAGKLTFWKMCISSCRSTLQYIAMHRCGFFGK